MNISEHLRMTEVEIGNIDNYRISELSGYFFKITDLTKKISQKIIKNVNIFDLLHLIRRRNYTEIATVLAARYFTINRFNGFSFNYDDKSIAEQDLLKELVLLDEEFWQYNQDVYRQLAPIVEKNGCYLNLSNQFVELFLKITLREIVWSKYEIERINSLIHMDAASPVHSAWDMIRRLKRAIDEGVEVRFDWNGHVHKLATVDDLMDKIISLLPYPHDFKKALYKEIKIKK